MCNDNQLFFKIAANQKQESKQENKRKSYPNNDFILYRTDDDGKRPRLELNITNETAKQIIDYYETDTFSYTVNDMCGALCFIPNGEKSTVKICEGSSSNHHTISIKRKSKPIFDIVGEDIRRIFVVIGICQDGFLVLLDRKNENNEYANEGNGAS